MMEQLRVENNDVLATSVAIGMSTTSGASNVSQYPVHSLAIERCVYRGEGNVNLVVALPSERKVIRLRKSPTAAVAGDSESGKAVAAEAEVRREADFIRHVISGFLGGYVCSPEILRYSEPDIARLAEKIRLFRPESRRNKEIIGGYATKYPDYTFLPDHLSGFSSKPTYSVEIKPKQGFVCEADYRHFKKCPYCLKQYYKLKEGSIRQPSKYCPFDLFSGSADRMDRALTSLLLSPQNNLRIFKNGCSIYGEANQGTEVLQSILDGWFFGAGLEAFLLLVRTALSRDFDRVNNAAVAKRLSGRKLERTRVDAPPRLEPELVRCVQEVIQAAGVEECEPPPPPPPSSSSGYGSSGAAVGTGSALARILRMQRLHHIGDDVVAWIAANLRLPESLIYADLREARPSSPSNACQTEVITCVDETECKRKKLPNDPMICNELVDEDINDEYIKIMGNYSLFCTARDCSILMTFQEIDKESSETVNAENIIKLSNGQIFLTAVRVLDLDMKSPIIIEKHLQRDIAVLRAIINELKEK